MAQRGKPSTAHEYDSRGVCLYCHMYRNNVERMSHICTSDRELETDLREANAKGESLQDYRMGGVMEGGKWRTI